MKQYHTILKYKEEHFGKPVWAFNKVDGSNIRFEWDKKLSKKSRFTFGFKKFGTRTEMILNNRNPYIEAVTKFECCYAEKFDKIFTDSKELRGLERITLFGEFFGPGSFAGIHDWDINHELIFFDIFQFKKGFLPPGEFMKLFVELPIQRLVWQGILDKDFVNKIENNEFNLSEGVVYKGLDNGEVFMGKIKTFKWLDEVRSKYGEAKMLEY